MSRTAASAVGRQLLTFRVAGEHLALPASDVSEVIRPPGLTHVPLAPPSLRGIANLRGTVLPVVCLRSLLGSGVGASTLTSRVIVVDRAAPIGLEVDEVTVLTDYVVEDDREGTVAALGGGPAPARVLDLDNLLARTFEDFGRRASSPPVDRSMPKEDRSRARDDVSLVSFEVAGQDYALPLERVSEIVALPAEIAVVPRSEDAMLGVTTVRGELLPLVSLRALLGMRIDGRSDRARAKVLVARIGGNAIGLVADAMKEILRVLADDIDPLPAVLARSTGEAEIMGICRLEDGHRLVSILSTDRLLRDATRDGYLTGTDQKETGMVASETQAEASEQFVVFQLGGEEYGLPIAAVDQIVRLPDTLTRLPSSPDFVDGIMSLRGQVIPVIDQRKRFEFERSARTRRERVIVVTVDRTQAGFVVDGVTEVLKVPVSQLRPAPELANDRSRVLDRVANIEVDGRMILLLDSRELLDRAEKDLLAAMRLSESGRFGS
jgi:purine-binding chemotaxis protein CheW